MSKLLFSLLTFFLLGVAHAEAQNGILSVDTFHLAIGDARATGKDAVMDYGEPPRPCALIIVHLPIEGASVEKNRLGIVSIKNMPNNEIWIYAPAGIGGPDRIVVKHPSYQDLKVELGDWLESDGEGYLSSAAVYHLRIHVPSAKLTLAEQKLAKLKFKEANECYDWILSDSCLDVREKHFAQERKSRLHDWDRMLSLAQKYERKYDYDKSRNAPKSQIINDLDSIIHWYGILYNQSHISKANELKKKVSSIREEIAGKTTLHVKFRLIEVKGKGQYVMRKPQKLKEIKVNIEKINGLVEKLTIDETDKVGEALLSVVYSPENKFVFTYKEGKNVFKSEECQVTGDQKLTVNLKAKIK